ncbi:MAG: hypothetical protein RI988_3511 [Pseudomonadota bacterium]|jgi:hypothetical protein
MTDWIEHTGDTCPVDPETVVEVELQYGAGIKARSHAQPAHRFLWTEDGGITRYRIIAPAKPPEPEMPKTHEDYTGPTFGVPTKPEPDLITLRLECLKLAVQESVGNPPGVVSLEHFADRLLHYVLNGSVDKA